MTKFFTLLLAAALLAFPMVQASAEPKDVPLPNDITIVTPGSDVPKELAAFSGKWYGEWRGARTDTLMTDGILVVERVFPPYALIVAATSPSPQWKIQGGWARQTADFSNGALKVYFPATGATVTYRLKEDGTISAVSEHPGGTWRSTLTRLGD